MATPPEVPWWARVVVAGWVAVNAALLVRGLLPPTVPGSGRLPWSMFREPPAQTRIVAEGQDASGRWIEIPLAEIFEFRRGWSDRGVPETSRYLYGRGSTAERAAFARWLAAQMAAAGTPVRVVRLTHLAFDGSGRTWPIGQFEVDGAAGG